MKRKLLRFGKELRVATGNDQSQAPEMTLPPGDAEGGPLRQVGGRVHAAAVAALNQYRRWIAGADETISPSTTSRKKLWAIRAVKPFPTKTLAR